jgi:hypothetical protein
MMMQGRAEADVTWQSEARLQEQIGNPISHVDIPSAQNTTAVYAGAAVMFGWQRATCIDEWTIAACNLAMGASLLLGGSGAYSIDNVLIRRNPALAEWLRWMAGSLPLPRSPPQHHYRTLWSRCPRHLEGHSIATQFLRSIIQCSAPESSASLVMSR